MACPRGLYCQSAPQHGWLQRSALQTRSAGTAAPTSNCYTHHQDVVSAEPPASQKGTAPVGDSTSCNKGWQEISSPALNSSEGPGTSEISTPPVSNRRQLIEHLGRQIAVLGEAPEHATNCEAEASQKRRSNLQAVCNQPKKPRLVTAASSSLPSQAGAAVRRLLTGSTTAIGRSTSYECAPG